jgi:hypothetical protein
MKDARLLKVKGQETHLTLHEHDDDDDKLFLSFLHEDEDVVSLTNAMFYDLF